MPSPGPTTQACTRPAACGFGAAMTSGQCETTSAAARSGVAHHAGGGRHRGTGAQDRRHRDRSTSRPCTPVTPWVYLSSWHAGYRPARGDVGGLESQEASVVGRSSPMSTSSTRPQSAEGMNGFEPAEGHGQRGAHSGPGDRAGQHVDAAGDVDGDHRDPGRARRRRTPRRPPGAAGPSPRCRPPRR